MKKPAKKLLLLIIVMYFFTAYTDFKKGFIEGFYQKSEEPVKAKIETIDRDYYEGFDFPLIIKIF